MQFGPKWYILTQCLKQFWNEFNVKAAVVLYCTWFATSLLGFRAAHLTAASMEISGHIWHLVVLAEEGWVQPTAIWASSYYCSAKSMLYKALVYTIKSVSLIKLDCYSGNSKPFPVWANTGKTGRRKKGNDNDWALAIPKNVNYLVIAPRRTNIHISNRLWAQVFQGVEQLLFKYQIPV